MRKLLLVMGIIICGISPLAWVVLTDEATVVLDGTTILVISLCLFGVIVAVLGVYGIDKGITSVEADQKFMGKREKHLSKIDIGLIVLGVLVFVYAKF